MHPDLFTFQTPGFLSGLLPEYLTVHTYGFCIVVGIALAFWFTYNKAKKELGFNLDRMLSLALFIIISAIVGGKIFFFLERPSYYILQPSHMLQGFNSGFVFYGSLLFAVPILLIFLKKNNIPAWPMLDIIAFTAVILQAFGRLGCFFAGCCQGKPTEGIMGVIFSDPACAAEIKGIPVHPTQLYEVASLVIIFFLLSFIRRIRKFEGQIFLTYLFLYGLSRGFIEIFRGDNDRSFIVPGVFSQAQLISVILMIVACILCLMKLRKIKAEEA